MDQTRLVLVAVIERTEKSRSYPGLNTLYEDHQYTLELTHEEYKKLTEHAEVNGEFRITDKGKSVHVKDLIFVFKQT